MLSKGNKVMVLDDAINGVVLAIKGDEITIETEEGFELNFQAKELLKIENQNNILKNINSYSVDKIVQEKKFFKPRSLVKEKRLKKEDFFLEIDLHIEKLVPNRKGMSNYDILTIQTETAQRKIEFAITKRISKIVFIHGIGAGILKAELDFILGSYDSIYFQDANYKKYGSGATEVYIKQNVKSKNIF